MDRKHQISICKECEHQFFDTQVGIICGLTKELQTFDVQCDKFVHSTKDSKSIVDNYSNRTPIAESATRMEARLVEMEAKNKERNLRHKVDMQSIKEKNNEWKENNNKAVVGANGSIAEYKKINSGANWFNIIAILSIINSILVYTGTELNFIFGLGSTTLLDVLVRDITGNESVLLLLPQFILAGIFLACGYAGKKQSTSAYLVGIILYSLDALVFLLFKNYLAIGFHGFALIGMIKGFSHLRRLKSFEEKE